MARIIRIQWAGEILAGTVTTAPVLDIFSNTVHVLDSAETLDLASYTGVVSSALQAFWTAAASKMSNSVFVRTLKVNFIDPQTGLQITDPTNQVDYPNLKGAAAGSFYLPITTAMRVSMDNGTRNRKARGGVYLPLPTLNLLENRRWASEDLGPLLTNFKTFMTALEGVGGTNLIVYSRTLAGGFPVSRLRIGDVPDNIRTRKNALAEVYTTQTI